MLTDKETGSQRGKRSNSDMISLCQTSTKKKAVRPEYHSNIVINSALLAWLTPRVKSRAGERLFLIPTEDSNKWQGFNLVNNKEVVLEGTYAYVVHTAQTTAQRKYPSPYVAWPIKAHNETFHIGLSDFAEFVAAAGECGFIKSNLTFFDRGSGTYNPKDTIQYTAGFPPEKYVALTYAP